MILNEEILMAIPVAKIHYLGQIFSPFSGLPAESDDGPNEGDPTLLCVYYGDASEFGYVSDRLQELSGVDFDTVEVEELSASLTVDGGIVLEVDTEWNGLNYYFFAPA